MGRKPILGTLTIVILLVGLYVITRTPSPTQAPSPSAKAVATAPSAHVPTSKIATSSAHPLIAQGDHQAGLKRMLRDLNQHLGNDATAKVITQLIDQEAQRQLTGKMPSPWVDCSKQATCPMDLRKLYGEAFARIPIQNFAFMKEIMLDDLAASDVDPETKASIYAAEAVSNVYQDLPNETKVVGPNQIQFSSASMYQLECETDYLRLSPTVDDAVKLTAQAIASTSDPAVKNALGQMLFNYYPTNLNEYGAQMTALGVDYSGDGYGLKVGSK
jgi:hypothetical protein